MKTTSSVPGAVPVSSESAARTGPLRISAGADPQWAQLERGVMAVALVSLGLRTTLITGVTVGFVVAVVLAPVWIQYLKTFWGARALMLLGLGSLVSGLWLAALANNGRIVTRTGAMADCFLLVGVLSGVGVILWCRSRLSARQIGVWYGMGLLVNVFFHSRDLTAVANPWKFSYLVPVAIVVLSVLNISKRRKIEVVAVAILAVTCVLSDARSYFATFLLVLVLVTWQIRPTAMSRQKSGIWTAGLMGGLGAGIYYLGKALLVNGYLGPDAQARSLEQIRTAGSLLLGGRPELAAAVALIQDHPWGYGVGLSPTLNDVNTARAGMFSMLNYQPDAGYVEHFMFGGHIELHSTLGDWWAHFGVIGIVLCLLIAFHVSRGLALRIGGRQASGILLFLGWWTLWNLMFSPAYSAVPTLTLALGLLLFRQESTRSGTLPSGQIATRGAGLT